MPTQAILVHQFGGPEMLELQSLPTPQAAAGQAVVRLEYAGINFVDLYQREGRYPNISLPWRLGLEGAGEIVDIAPGAEFQVGDRVAFTTGVQGAYASHLAVPPEHLVRVPDALALRDAAAALEHGLTAAMLLDDVARLPAGEAVLVHAAAGGVGGWLVQWLIARGHPVFGTVSSAAKAEWLRSVGAVPLLTSSDWVSAARGVAVVFDSVGRSTFAGSLDALRVGGHLVLFGAASGQPEPVDVLALQKKSLTLTRPVLPHFLPDAAKRRERAATVFEAVLSGAVQLRIHAEFPLADVAGAHELLASRATQGKLLLKP
ncbi:NADPH2:quinone reductase [Pelomonas saccharophila]|uniref:NADPH2:quinone reductase n=1 Tax=Roseateles saccharophilus TaxID=304 RepID=A0ABU1YLH3_ROSSA|nr:quinone oxidoreductase [Roseateles saccharophilus]MDR7269709.1 NADPH2:quinone reductase [Roseateles saccharophilus]